jgi:hypothetical protein
VSRKSFSKKLDSDFGFKEQVRFNQEKSSISDGGKVQGKGLG